MLITITVFSLIVYGGISIDPDTFDYCTLNCEDQEHVACNCIVMPPRIIFESDIKDFRKKILYSHNSWRNGVANGSVKTIRFVFPIAYDMMYMNYDLELEKLAYCFAGKYDLQYYTCRNLSNGQTPGQSLSGTSERKADPQAMMKVWYDEINNVMHRKDIENLPDLNLTNKGKIRHFVQMVYAKTDLVGCARVWNHELVNKAWRHTLVCNYGSSTGSGGPKKGEPLYNTSGISCITDCFDRISCRDKELNALCGDRNPLPIAPAPRSLRGSCFYRSKSNDIRKNSVILVFSLFILLLLR